MGLYGWACVGLCRGGVPVVVFPVSKPLQSNGKQTTPTTGKTLARYFLLFYCDMKNKRQKQGHRTQQKQK